MFGTSIALFSANNASFESYGLTDRDVSGVAVQDAELIAAFIDNCEKNKDDFLNSDFKILFFYETNGTPVMGDNVINPLSPGSGSNIFTYDRMNADVDVDVDGVARKQLLLDFSNAVYNHKLIDFKFNVTELSGLLKQLNRDLSTLTDRVDKHDQSIDEMRIDIAKIKEHLGVDNHEDNN